MYAFCRSEKSILNGKIFTIRSKSKSKEIFAKYLRQKKQGDSDILYFELKYIKKSGKKRKN